MPKQYPSELRQRAVRLVVEQREQYEMEWEAARSVAAKLGIGSSTPTQRPSGYRSKRHHSQPRVAV